MIYSLKAKLIFTYMLIALISILLISILTNLFLDEHFKQYVINNQKRESQEIINLISEQYSSRNKWDINFIENIGIRALENGLIIKVTDNNNDIIWDAAQHNNGMCERMLYSMSQNMLSRYPNWDGGYVEDSFTINNRLSKIGTLTIGYYGPYFFNDSDLAFINTINRLLVWVGIISLVLSIFLGALISKRISNPIERVINATGLISKGYYKDRITEKSKTKEIYKLTSSVNDLAKALESQDDLRKRITADLAHELRTPLATLQSHLEAMIDGIWKADKERLEGCHSEIIRINRMVGDLEKLAKFESDNLVLNKTKINIFEVIDEVLDNFENEFFVKKIEHELIKDESDGEILADRDKLIQVFINIISNCIKYTENSGRIFINIKSFDNNYCVEIKDTGIGISREDMPHIFERFYRADKSRNRLTGGSGIGLTIVKSIVEAHGGLIYAESEIGAGTSFLIELPKL